MAADPAINGVFMEDHIVKDATGANAKRMKPNRERSSPEFNLLLDRLNLDHRLAWDAYEQLRRKLVTYFQRRGHHLEGEALADETLDRLARNPVLSKIETVATFALAIARNVRKEAFRKTPPRISIEQNADFPGQDENPERTILSAMDSKQKLECFLKCMKDLAPKERNLILSYYPTENDDLEGRRQRLAESLGIDAAALRARLARGRQKLEHCCSECYSKPVRYPA